MREKKDGVRNNVKRNNNCIRNCFWNTDYFIDGRETASASGASERKLAASWFYFSWKIEKEEKEKKKNEDKKKDSQRNEKK